MLGSVEASPPAYEQQYDYQIGGKWGTRVKLAIRAIQILIGLVIIGIYATDLGAGVKAGAGAHPNWVFAVTVGLIAVLTASLYLVPAVKAFALFWWDFVIVVLHAALVGAFGRAYVGPRGQDAPPDTVGPDAIRMRNTVFLDAASGILWLLTGSLGLLVMLRVRRKCATGGYVDSELGKNSANKVFNRFW